MRKLRRNGKSFKVHLNLCSKLWRKSHSSRKGWTSMKSRYKDVSKIIRKRKWRGLKSLKACTRNIQRWPEQPKTRLKWFNSYRISLKVCRRLSTVKPKRFLTLSVRKTWKKSISWKTQKDNWLRISPNPSLKRKNCLMIYTEPAFIRRDRKLK